MVRNIIESYFYNNYKPVTNEKGDIILPWGGQSTNTPGRPARGEADKTIQIPQAVQPTDNYYAVCTKSERKTY